MNVNAPYNHYHLCLFFFLKFGGYGSQTKRKIKFFFVQGKGSVSTFWLLGKADFPFHVDVEAAEKLVDSYTYWKDQFYELQHEAENENEDLKRK